jgi:hypothetical protein
LSGAQPAQGLRVKTETHRFWHVRGLWHVRLAGAVRGPFPTAAIAQDLVLGRLPSDVEVSGDMVAWTPAAETDGFSCLRLPRQADAWAVERREALRRWADQRSGQDRRASGPRPEPDRRRAGGWRRTISLARHSGAGGWVSVASLGAVLVGLALATAMLGHALPIYLLQ